MLYTCTLKDHTTDNPNISHCFTFSLTFIMTETGSVQVLYICRRNINKKKNGIRIIKVLFTERPRILLFV